MGKFQPVILWQDRYYTGWEAWLPELWKVMGLPQMPLSQADGNLEG